MEPSEQQKFIPIIKERIETIREQIAKSAEDRKAISPDKAIGRLSRLDSMQMQQMAVASKSRMEQEIRDLEEALQKIANHRFGRCQLCGQDIAVERLEYQPGASCCVQCLNRRSSK